jgi:hypothetical protein
MKFQNLRRIAVAAAVIAAIPAASAEAALIETGACDDAALTQPFAPWGDRAYYKLAPGGDFEGAHGWSLRGGAATVSGSEPFRATGEAGASSVRIPAGGSITSPATCVNAAYPTFRLFAKSSGGLLGLVPLMKAEVLYRDGLLGIIAVPAGVVTPSATWSPTGAQLTLSAVGAAVAGGEAPLSIRLTSVLGTWTVDDVFVDPYRRI